MLIYIVEDDESIRELESYALTNHGYEVNSFSNSSDFYQSIACVTPDLILLDVMLPGDDGLTILKKIRENAAFSEIPVIILSAKTTELDRVKGLDLGADDYVCKPFGVMELVSRVRARLRNSDQKKKYVFEKLTLSDDARAVMADGTSVDLTYKEFELLKLLIASPATVFRRDYILDTIWGHDSTGRTLDVHIRTLRSKLGSCGRYIVTVRGVGYKLDKEA